MEKSELPVRAKSGVMAQDVISALSQLYSFIHPVSVS